MNALHELDINALVNPLYTIGGIARSLYLVLQLQFGSDKSIILSTGISPKELSALKSGDNNLSIELFQRACANSFMQFIYSISDTGIQARVKVARKVYRLTP